MAGAGPLHLHAALAAERRIGVEGAGRALVEEDRTSTTDGTGASDASTTPASRVRFSSTPGSVGWMRSPMVRMPSSLRSSRGR